MLFRLYLTSDFSAPLYPERVGDPLVSQQLEVERLEAGALFGREAEGQPGLSTHICHN